MYLRRPRFARNAPFLLGVFAVGVCTSLALSIFLVSSAAGVIGVSAGPPGLILVNGLFAGSLLLISRSLLHHEGCSLRELGLAPTRRRIQEYIAGFVLTSTTFLLAAIAQAASVGASWQFQGIAGLRAALLGVGVTTVLALAEELVFRGVALRYLRRLYGDRAAVVLSALLFGAYHLAQSDDWAIGAVFRLLMPALGGLLFAWAAVRSKGLALPLGLHVGGNWIQFAVAGFAPGTKPVTALWRIPITTMDLRSLTAPDFLPHLPYILALGLTAAIAWQMTSPHNSQHRTA